MQSKKIFKCCMWVTNFYYNFLILTTVLGVGSCDNQSTILEVSTSNKALWPFLLIDSATNGYSLVTRMPCFPPCCMSPGGSFRSWCWKSLASRMFVRDQHLLREEIKKQIRQRKSNCNSGLTKPWSGLREEL